jgi:hypothetical protein
VDLNLLRIMDRYKHSGLSDCYTLSQADISQQREQSTNSLQTFYKHNIYYRISTCLSTI